jgi:hypothetical protein
VKIRRVVIPALVLVAASLAPTASADRPDDRAGVRAPGMIAAHSSVRPDDRAGTRGAAGVSDSVELATADRPDDRIGARGPDGGVIVAAAAEPAPAAFHWHDAMIGSLGGIGIALVLTAALFLFMRRRRGARIA